MKTFSNMQKSMFFSNLKFCFNLFLEIDDFCCLWHFLSTYIIALYFENEEPCVVISAWVRSQKIPKFLYLLQSQECRYLLQQNFCYNKNSEKMWRTILKVLKDVQNDLKCDKNILFFSDSHTLIRNISNMKYQG